MSFKKITKIADSITTVWILVAIALMFIVIVLEVVLREILNLPLTWHLEVSQYCLINVTYVGAAAAFRLRAHISINLLTSNFSQPMERYVNLIGRFFLVPFFVLLAYSGFDILLKSKGVTPSLQLPISIYYFPIFVGSLFLCFYSLVEIIAEITSIRNKAG